MAFECSLEIIIRNTNYPELESLATLTPSQYAINANKKTGHLSISIDDFEFQDWLSFDKSACEFIDELRSLKGLLTQNDSVFRIAIYYDTNETLVLPIRLSKNLLHHISTMSLSLDIVGYPYSDES